MKWMVVAVLALLTVACADEQLFTPRPDPVTGPSSSSTSSGGAGGSTSSAGGGGESNVGWQSGGRLRAQIYEGDDTSRQFRGWWDSEREEECAFGAAADGKTRCLPTSRALAFSYYDNSGCAGDPLVPISPGQCFGAEALPKYGFVTEGSCPTTARLFLLGGAYGGQFAYVGMPGNCNPVPTPTNPMLYELAQEIPATSFQEATIVVE